MLQCVAQALGSSLPPCPSLPLAPSATVEAALLGASGHTCALSTTFQGLKNQARVKLNIVRCPPVTTVLIRRPDLRYQLGFSVQNGIVSVTLPSPRMLAGQV